MPSRWLTTIGLAFSWLIAGAAGAGELRADAEAAVQRDMGAYLDLLRLPNVASTPADIARNADALVLAFARRGFTTKVVPNAAGRVPSPSARCHP